MCEPRIRCVHRLLLVFLLCAGAGCESTSRSVCLDEPKAYGCWADIRPSPGRLNRSTGAAVDLDFVDPGLAARLRLAPKMTITLRQAAAFPAELLSVGVQDTGLRVAVPPEVLKLFGDGDAVINIAIGAGSVDVPVRLFFGPQFIRSNVLELPLDSGAKPVKWAGLRKKEGIDLFTFEPLESPMGINRFVRYRVGDFKVQRIGATDIQQTSSCAPAVGPNNYFSACYNSLTDSQRLRLIEPNARPAGTALESEFYLELIRGKRDPSPVSDIQDDLLLVPGRLPDGVSVFAAATPGSTLLTEVQQLPLGMPVRSLATGDLNQDGLTDILVWTGDVAKVYLRMSRDSFREDDLALSAFLTSRLRLIEQEAPITALAIGNIDGSGQPDVLAASTKNIRWISFEKGVGLQNEPFELPLPPIWLGTVKQLAVADLDNDKLDDLTVVTEDKVYFLLNTPSR